MEQDDFEELKLKSILLRGQILEGCVTLEWLIDSYIGQLYTSWDKLIYKMRLLIL